MSGSTKHVSGFFDRLRLVADLDYSDAEQDQAYEAALARIDACVERVKAYGKGNGFHSQLVRDAIDERVGDLCARLGAARARLVDGYEAQRRARESMTRTKEAFETNVAQTLLTPAEMAWQVLYGAQVAQVPVLGTLAHATMDTYFAALERERNVLREATCQVMLTVFNQELDGHAKAIQKVAERDSNIAPPSTTAPVRSASSGPQGTDPSGSGYGLGGVGGAVGGGPAEGGLGAPAVGGAWSSAAGGVLPGEEWASEGFARPGLPQDAPARVAVGDLEGVGLQGRPMNVEVTPNGLVGGYVPPFADRASDPRWDPAYRIPSEVVDASRRAARGAFASGPLGAGSAMASARGLISGTGVGGVLSASVGAAAGAARAGAAGSGGQPGFVPGVPFAPMAAGEDSRGRGARDRGRADEDEEEDEEQVVDGLDWEVEECHEPVWDPAHGPGSADDGVEFEIDWEEWER
ncbi:hypothetical protein [Pauljensenia hongkongensis]|uniref:Uncharacterized protein n=1 Tax=Pauljensenia hongkongensis TaxID=178339 RepID=A0A1D8B435_9ACTO|nr:hypothetical protein [Pauljensenia hongkongensis]AOS47893.1 hypothetical protein BH719_08645 [Pauljensenia hongkongensis]EFW09162.1 hypothetical protein HMPREF9005_1849 [Actinomyces sp. oral taxon 178 str. F0338]